MALPWAELNSLSGWLFVKNRLKAQLISPYGNILGFLIVFEIWFVNYTKYKSKKSFQPSVDFAIGWLIVVLFFKIVNISKQKQKIFTIRICGEAGFIDALSMGWSIEPKTRDK